MEKPIYRDYLNGFNDLNYNFSCLCNQDLDIAIDEITDYLELLQNEADKRENWHKFSW